MADLNAHPGYVEQARTAGQRVVLRVLHPAFNRGGARAQGIDPRRQADDCPRQLGVRRREEQTSQRLAGSPPQCKRSFPLPPLHIMRHGSGGQEALLGSPPGTSPCG